MWPWSVKKKRLIAAAREGDLAAVRDLVETQNVNVNACDEYAMTPLHWAARRGHSEIAELLLKYNAAVDATSKLKNTPLHEASSQGHAGVVELLLKVNASVDVASRRGFTPLYEACRSHRPDIARMLLVAGANLNATDKDGLKPMHSMVKVDEFQRPSTGMLDTLKVLVEHGATWDAPCEDMIATGNARYEAPALALCMSLWTQEHADGLELTNIPIEVVKRGAESTQTYIDTLQASIEVVLRRKVCLVGPGCAGKTSLVKSITSKQPQLVHLDNRTIGIDHFPLRFEQSDARRKGVTIHEVTFWDFAGQDAYQVAHSLFFSPRTLFLVCVDLEAFAVAFLQASIMSNLKKQETHLMDEFIERTVMKWIRIIMARQPDAQFAFVATKEDLLKENIATERLLKNTLAAYLKDVNASKQKMRSRLQSTDQSPDERTSGSIEASNVLFVSCSSPGSVQAARVEIERTICMSDRSFQMPDTYTQALQAIVTMRANAKSHDVTTRINRVFALVKTLPSKLKLKPELCRIILQTLHDLGDVLWYEDLGVELFHDRVILDPLLLIDFIRQVINHNYTGQIMPHADLKSLPYWSGLSDKEQMKALKQVLQKFHLVYSADDDRMMKWDSDLIVPAYWQTKTPASWLFLGDILRINPTKARSQLSLSDIMGSNSTKSCEGEAMRVHWEFHFEFGLPSSLFDHLVVASVSPCFTFDAGPDWIMYDEKDATACRVMVGRDPKSLHRTIHVEAVVAVTANSSQVEVLWDSFEQLIRAFAGVMHEYSGLNLSSFAWDNADKKIGLKRLMLSNINTSTSRKWMPPAKTWALVKQLMQHQMMREE